MKKRIIIISILLIACGILGAALLLLPKKDKFEPVTEEVTVDLEGIEKPVKILWLSDLHIVTLSKTLPKGYRKDVKARIQFSQNSADKWEKNWPDYINSSGADLVVFGGDMIDFASKENTLILRDGLDKLTIPYIYLRCDHDKMPSYISEQEAEATAQIRDNLCDNSDMITYEFENFIVVGWNWSSDDITDNGLEKMRNICSQGKPILLMTHVPIAPVSDTSLSDRSREIFDGRSLLWGYNDDYYWPEFNTRQFLDIVYADDSPIAEVFCGHLHFSWDGYITDTVKEHVFSPALEESCGIITVK